MTGDGDRFEVRLGRMRSPSGARKVEGFFRKVSKGARKLGRGGGRGRSQRSAARTQFYRRVLVKVRVVSMDPKGRLAQKLHLRKPHTAPADDRVATGDKRWWYTAHDLHDPQVPEGREATLAKQTESLANLLKPTVSQTKRLEPDPHGRPPEHPWSS